MLHGPKFKSEQEIINIRVNSDIDSYISESDVESQVSVESLELPEEINVEENLNQLTSAKLQANRVYLDEEAGVWQFVESPNATLGDIQIVKKPTASAMMHLVLNPFINRSLQPIDSLGALAAIVGAPSNWLDIVNQKVMNNSKIQRLYREFVSLNMSGSESIIQDSFDALVVQVGSCLDITVRGFHNQSFVIGGILARPHYDIRGRSDTVFRGWSGNALLATESCGDDDRDVSLENDLSQTKTPLKSYEFQSTGISTGKQIGNKRKRDGEDDQKVARSQKLQLIQPKFVSGFINTAPIYTRVRIMPDDEVRDLEQLLIDLDKRPR
ncbi:hypothetical protein MP228_005030 [Amoeboaphelidium protococcarum]|nr:hypothetical protein MP228_005030 [Amoeboaphelidium protococcarum]